jgi:hypothetical protein
MNSPPLAECPGAPAGIDVPMPISSNPGREQQRLGRSVMPKRAL